MSYPKAEMIIRDAPIHALVMVEPVTQELYGHTTYIPDPDAVRTELLRGEYGLTYLAPGESQALVEHLCEQVQERLDGLQGREGYAPAT